MTLRRRLGVAIAALLVIMALAFGGVFLTQRGYQLSQLDDRLAGLSANTKALVAISTRADAGTGAARRSDDCRWRVVVPAHGA